MVITDIVINVLLGRVTRHPAGMHCPAGDDAFVSSWTLALDHLLVYKSLHGLAPPYLADYCILASSDKFRRRLRLADVDTCIVPRTRTRFGDRSFSAAGPRIWNSLPPDLRRPDIELSEFRPLSKTFLFV